MSLKSSNKTYAVIMAGGRSERFWPLSTENTPKPFLPLLGKKSLIQMTVERITPLIPFSRILVVLGKKHLRLAKEQLSGIPSKNFLVEPESKDTAPCIGFASLYLEKEDPEAIMVVIPADHYIPDKTIYLHFLSTALQLLVKRNEIITFGIKPSRPEIGYGYIQAESAIERINNIPFFKVKRFVEKPDQKTAKRYFMSNKFYWNSGIFVWRNQKIQELIKKYLPEVWDGLNRIKKKLGDPKVISDEFRRFPRISIDYGVLEKTRNILMIPAEFRWDDIGNWAALERFQTFNQGHILSGKSWCKDTKNCVIYAQDHLVATIGVSDLIIVQANGKLLICHKDRAQEVREVSRYFNESPKC